MDSLPHLPQHIRDRYRVEPEPVGKGGFATVYRAHDAELKRDVAIKLYQPDNAEEAKQFANEAQILASLSHPNIVTVYDFATVENHAVIVMAYLPGGSLRDKMKLNKTPMRPQDALSLTAVLAEALQAAHDADILHLDIKPENIIFDGRGRPFLTDFGIGRVMGGDGETHQTRAMGTNNYASPEQRQAGKLTRASDIYSLGVVLFELLTGQVPLGPAAANPQPPFSPPFPLNHPMTSAEALVQLVCKALAVAPVYRYESALQFAQQIRDYMLHAGGDTGRLTPSFRGFAPLAIASVELEEPKRQVPLRSADMRRMPQTMRQLEDDLTPVPPGTHVSNLLYSHQGLEVGVGSVVEEAVFGRGRVRLRQDALVRGDVMSLTMIDVSQGVQATNLVAPEVMVRGPIRLAGSIFCRRLRPAQGDQGTHLPDNSTLGGSLIFGKQFEKIVPDEELGRPLKAERPPIEFYGERPTIAIGTRCTLVAILGDVNVEVGARQTQLNTIRVAGNVTLGPFNTVRRIEGDNIHIGPGCVVNEVYARGTLTIERDSSVGYVRAGQGIRLANGVSIASPIVFSDNGAIEEQGEARWNVAGNRSGLTAQHIFELQQIEAQRGSLATILLDHRLYELYERIAPKWLPRLKPRPFEGSGERVHLPPQPKSLPEPEGYPELHMDLTPASQREDAEPLLADAAPPAERRGTHIVVPAPEPAAPGEPAAAAARRAAARRADPACCQ